MDIEKGEEFEQKQRAKPSLQVVRSYEDCLRGCVGHNLPSVPMEPTRRRWCTYKCYCMKREWPEICSLLFQVKSQ